ncbi:hypothetical protein LAZ67_1002906 [Cordylochernes scorpioides]|uniref:Peptidase C1A papain C-terminal domain-containing protein n=1 Tax=Cordylochernes scorpioides TaxID=51811 RepID=A0ABY6JWR8_9ARAC|nr:hypothetical protein LAZ67_1002906 [Cordylochernes scorpioides]
MKDQGICIKFCVKNEFKSAEIFRMLQTAYGDAVMSRTRVFEWYKCFKEGREETANNERSGRPSTSTTPKKVNKGGRRRSWDIIRVDSIDNEGHFGSEKTQRPTTDDPELLKRVITGDEIWIYGFDSETNQQASERCFKNEPRPKKAGKAPKKVKVMLTVFFDYQGIVHHEFQQQGSTITVDSYLGVLRRLREAIRQKLPELLRSKSWILHHDNAPAYTALKISKFLQDHSTSVFPLPPYNPDLAPCDSFFLESSKKVKGTHLRFKPEEYCPTHNLEYELGMHSYYLGINKYSNWHFRFKTGRISIEDYPRQGRPKFQRTDENVQKFTDLIKENLRTSLLELEQDTGISKPTIGRIVTEDLKLKKTPAKFIQDSSLIGKTYKIITGDETWVYGYDPETKRQSAEWRGQGNVLGILRRLREAIRKKRPEKWTNGDWILHHDNARPHIAHLVTRFLAKNGTQILPQPLYSSDIVPNDFFLFPKLKKVLKGRQFQTRDDIIEKSPLALKSIPKELYKNCFDNLGKRWRCQEFTKHMNGLIVSEDRTMDLFEPSGDIEFPSSLDWRSKGYITEVKDQGQCGSCWAFSTTGGLEGQHYRKSGKLVSLSEKNLLDCSTSNNGCDGGDILTLGFRIIAIDPCLVACDYLVFTFRIRTCHLQHVLAGVFLSFKSSVTILPIVGLEMPVSCSSSSKEVRRFSFIKSRDQCQYNKSNIGATCKDFLSVNQDEECLKQALAAVGPLSIAIDASGKAFQQYKGGVYNNPDCKNDYRHLDHGVLLVGYGQENGIDYWLVKNSWTESWGEKGYFKMSRNKNNQCGIATFALYLVV